MSERIFVHDTHLLRLYQCVACLFGRHCSLDSRPTMNLNKKYISLFSTNRFQETVCLLKTLSQVGHG